MASGLVVAVLAGLLFLSAGFAAPAEAPQPCVRDARAALDAQWLAAFGPEATVEGPKLPWRGFGHVFLGAPGPILAYPYGPELIRLCIDVPLSAPKGREAMRAYVRENFAE